MLEGDFPNALLHSQGDPARPGPLQLEQERNRNLGRRSWGLRVGQDARGRPYVFGGRGGLYFRERLGKARGGGCGTVLFALLAGAVLLALLVAAENQEAADKAILGQTRPAHESSIRVSAPKVTP